MTQYADDLTLTLSTIKSVSETFKLLHDFEKCSGLCVNKDKTEILLLGSLQGKFLSVDNIKVSNQAIKILGIYFSSDPNEIISKNFDSKIESLLRQLHWWKARDLTLQGRVLIAKTIGISKFQYIASLIYIPENIVSKVNSILHEFVWKSKTDKVKRKIFEQDFSKGGFKMINLEHIITASSVIWVKKYLDCINRQWKSSFEYFCNKLNLCLYLQSKFNINELPKNVPKYYFNSICNWRKVSKECSKPFSQIIWYNTDIKIGDHSIYNHRLFSMGIWNINDLFNNNILIPFSTWRARGALDKDYLTWLAISKIINENIRYTEQLSSGVKCGVEIDGKFIEIQYLAQRDIKKVLLHDRYNSLTESDFKFKIKAVKLYGEIDAEDWKNVFILPRILPIDNKLKELQYKIIMRYVSTNYLLHKMKIINSQTCSFCKMYPETIDHLFYHCTEVRNIWLYILAKWQSITGTFASISLKHFILGMYTNLKDTTTKSLNIAIILLKYYILKCRYEQCDLSVMGFESMCRTKIQLYRSVYNDETLQSLAEMFLV